MTRVYPGPGYTGTSTQKSNNSYFKKSAPTIVDLGGRNGRLPAPTGASGFTSGAEEKAGVVRKAEKAEQKAEESNIAAERKGDNRTRRTPRPFLLRSCAPPNMAVLPIPDVPASPGSRIYPVPTSGDKFGPLQTT